MTGSIVASFCKLILAWFWWLFFSRPMTKLIINISYVSLHILPDQIGFNCDHSGSLIWNFSCLFLLHEMGRSAISPRNYDSKQHFISPFALLLLFFWISLKTYLGLYWIYASLLQCQSFFFSSLIIFENCISELKAVPLWSISDNSINKYYFPQLSKYFR